MCTQRLSSGSSQAKGEWVHVKVRAKLVYALAQTHMQTLIYSLYPTPLVVPAAIDPAQQHSLRSALQRSGRGSVLAVIVLRSALCVLRGTLPQSPHHYLQQH